MADKFVLLLEFTSGVIEPLPLSADALTPERIVIIIDELKERVWLWQGAQTSLVERRAAQRKARSLVSAGYQLGPLKIGRDVSGIEIVEAEILEEPDVKELYNQLIHTLSQQFKITDQVLGRFSGKPTPMKAAPPPSTPSPSAPISPPTSEPSPAVRTVEAVAPSPSRDMQDLGVIRVGILISTILDHFPLCYINVNKIVDGTRYTIEDPDGIICELEVQQGSVHFLQRYDFRGKRKEILALLRDRLAAADL